MQKIEELDKAPLVTDTAVVMNSDTYDKTMRITKVYIPIGKHLEKRGNSKAGLSKLSMKWNEGIKPSTISGKTTAKKFIASRSLFPRPIESDSQTPFE